MGFVEDEEKMFEERMMTESARISKRNRRNKKRVLVLLLLVLVGAVFVIKNYVGTEDSDNIYTDDPEVRSQLIEKWNQVGYIISYDALKSTCVFNEERWYEYSDEDKIAVATLLDNYYANVKGAGHSGITIIGSNTSGVIAIADAGSVKLQR